MTWWDFVTLLAAAIVLTLLLCGGLYLSLPFLGLPLWGPAPF